MSMTDEYVKINAELDAELGISTQFCVTCKEMWEKHYRGRHISFTSTWLSHARGDKINDSHRFAFNCTREHVLTPGRIPGEATWANTDLPSIYEAACEVGEVDPGVLASWESFRDIIQRADNEGRVIWRKASH